MEAPAPAEAAAPPGRWRPGPAGWLLLLLPAHVLLLALVALAPGALETVYGRGLYPALTWLRLPLDATRLSPALTLLVVLLIQAARRAWSRGAPGPGRLRRGGLAAAWELALVAALVAHLFPPLWGLNYLRPSAAARLGLELEPVDAGRFAETARRVVEATNRARVVWGQPDVRGLDLAADRALRARLAELGLDEAAFPRRTRLYPRGMAMAGGWHGVTLPWTTEAWVDLAMDVRFVPHALAHEKAHQAGFAREADANFLAWLALVRAPEPRLRYSTLFYVVDLFRASSATPLSPEVLADMGEAVVVTEAAVVPVVEQATHQAYDTYLKVNQVQAGVLDYDRVALLIHAWLEAHPDALSGP